MSVQRKAQAFMRKDIFAKVSKRSGLPAVVHVTIATGKRWSFLHDRPMQFSNGQHLLRYVCMTVKTAVRHGLALPRRGVTYPAFRYLPMRANPTQRFTGLVI